MYEKFLRIIFEQIFRYLIQTNILSLICTIALLFENNIPIALSFKEIYRKITENMHSNEAANKIAF